jgi:hypothetical protein
MAQKLATDRHRLHFREGLSRSLLPGFCVVLSNNQGAVMHHAHKTIQSEIFCNRFTIVGQFAVFNRLTLEIL